MATRKRWILFHPTTKISGVLFICFFFLFFFFPPRSVGGSKLHRCRAMAEGSAAASIMHFGTVTHTPRAWSLSHQTFLFRSELKTTEKKDECSSDMWLGLLLDLLPILCLASKLKSGTSPSVTRAAVPFSAHVPILSISFRPLSSGTVSSNRFRRQ